MKLNRLALETSPYLKQHEHNPVDWFPWGEEALAKSKAENKPILLSVGYSSCHWCHVMAHESFENPQIAQIMNENFICVKVDREERPDLDMIYQPVAQVFTRGGGWPLTVFLTPELKPFYGGTYFPPVDKYGRPGFPKVLMALVRDFHEKKDDVQMRAGKITDAIRSSGDVGELGKIDLSESVSEPRLREGLISSAQNLMEYLDPVNGGIGKAPKFPNTSALTFLWRMAGHQWVSEMDRRRFRDGVLKALGGMARGGIFDQIGGGFHRYSVDAEWVIPHYEKMLYDNGLLLKLYSEVLLQAGKNISEERVSLYARVLVKTVDWLEREMKSPEGLFYSALDADSMNSHQHLEEGAYYTWAEDEFTLETDRTAKADEIAAFKQMLTGLTEESRHGLTLQRFNTEIASSPMLEILMNKLGRIREKRARPGLDDKVLTSWASLTISGLSWASMAFELLEDEDSSVKTRKLAVNAWNALSKHAINSEGELSATVQKGKAKFAAYLDDEAFFLQSTLDLARADFKKAEEYFSFVEKRVDQVIQKFHDPEKFGFFFTQHQAKGVDANHPLIHRPKNFYDQAIPSGNGVMLSVLATIESNHPASDFTYLIKSEELNVFQNGFGMSEILGAMLLKTVGPVKVEDEESLAVRSNPFCIWRGAPSKNAPVQYCVGQTCHRGKFDPESFF